MSSNPNLATVRRKAAEMGAIIIEVREGAKHTIVILQTNDGRKVQMALSRYRVDPYIMEGWTRQALARASRDIFEEIASRAVNDNERM